MQALRVLNVDSLNVAVELLLGAVLVVSPPGDSDTESVRNTLNTLLPHLLVELGVHADVGSALLKPHRSVKIFYAFAFPPWRRRSMRSLRRTARGSDSRFMEGRGVAAARIPSTVAQTS